MAGRRKERSKALRLSEGEVNWLIRSSTSSSFSQCAFTQWQECLIRSLDTFKLTGYVLVTQIKYTYIFQRYIFSSVLSESFVLIPVKNEVFVFFRKTLKFMFIGVFACFVVLSNPSKSIFLVILKTPSRCRQVTLVFSSRRHYGKTSKFSILRAVQCYLISQNLDAWVPCSSSNLSAIEIAAARSWFVLFLFLPDF